MKYARQHVPYIKALFLGLLIIIFFSLPTMTTILDAPEYAGILRAIRPAATNNWDASAEDDPDAAGQDEIDDDIEGEAETLDFNGPSPLEPEERDEDLGSESGSESESEGERIDSDGDAKMVDMTAMHTVITEASKGVIEATDAEYKRYTCVSINLTC